MIACSFLGMYDLPAQASANDRLWTAIATRLIARGIAAPRHLTRDRAPEDLWRDPALLFGQACGYPLVSHALPLGVLALPDYDAPGCAAGRHRSLIVARATDAAATLADFRGRRAAINDPASNTGMNLFRAAIAPVAHGERFFADVVVTGSHRDSIRAILNDKADLTAIDAVSHAGLARFEPHLVERLRIVAETPSSPTLPFVTARTTPIETVTALRIVLTEAMADPALDDARATLFLHGIVPVPPDAFAALGAMAETAAALGYPDLA
ncbi:phosphate ABC transporter substrate-binding protein [Sphingomonas sp. Leaf339]|uniref:phosphate/phosphite/phosphonate ABC transporter substrate-binding protein n=1 Tax=Sphingomonas sp. Leaf339 TaxID=1736343 RepID=UPI0006FF2A70|nr:PhnD/SsuA/transferrin family substrate-binding protein [Sphingomonas sp. Leaf339]KQU53175.1 phosphate ABC transporter substrate-binding protein [Sphingomonas sp. Leaf339]